MAPIVLQQHYRYRHPSACMAIKKTLSQGFKLHLSVTERRQGHLRLSLEVPSMSESQVDLSSNEDWPSCQWWLEEVLLRGAAVGPGHWFSPSLSSTKMVSLEAETDARMVGLTRQDSNMVMINLVVANKEVKLLLSFTFFMSKSLCLSVVIQVPPFDVRDIAIARGLRA